jgi:hypothetical protein
MLDPGVETFNSEEEFEDHIQRLENIHSVIANRRVSLIFFSLFVLKGRAGMLYL